MDDQMDKIEESMKVLDLLSTFLVEDSENYIKADDIRVHVEEAFVKIRDIYESLDDDPLYGDYNDGPHN